MKSIEFILQRINKLATLLGGLAITLMMVHISCDIISRYFFNYPLPGTISIVSHYYMIIAIFIPLAFTEQNNESIKVDLINKIISERTKNNLNKFSNLYIAIISSLLSYSSWHLAMKNYHSNTSVMQGDYTISTWPSYFIFFAGVTLLGIYCLSKFLLDLTQKTIKE